MKNLVLLLFSLSLPLLGLETEPTLSRAQQERLSRLLEQATVDPSDAMEAAIAVPAEDRDPVLWRWMGDQQSAVERYEEAMEAYEAALQVLPTYRDVLLNHARAAIAAETPERALPAVQRALGAGLREPRVYEALALLAEAAGDNVVAESAYRAVLLADAGHGPSREGLVRVLLRQERHAEAEAMVRGLLDTHPDRLGLWRLYADLAQSRDDTGRAVARLETAARLGLLETSDRTRLMELYASLDRPVEVLRLYRETPDARQDARLRLRLAEGLLGLGRLEPARELLAGLETVRTTEDRIRLARVRAHLLLHADEAGDAAALLAEALKEAPLDPGLLRLTGEAWMQADQPREAIPYFERLSRLPGHQARGLWMQGVAEARTGNLREAIRILETARQIEDLPGLQRTLEQVRMMSE